MRKLMVAIALGLTLALGVWLAVGANATSTVRSRSTTARTASHASVNHGCPPLRHGKRQAASSRSQRGRQVRGE